MRGCADAAPCVDSGWATRAAGDHRLGRLGDASASGKLVGCAKKSGGALRLVGTVKDCRKTERAVSWSPVGRPGPRGPAGARGPAGEDGAGRHRRRGWPRRGRRRRRFRWVSTALTPGPGKRLYVFLAGGRSASDPGRRLFRRRLPAAVSAGRERRRQGHGSRLDRPCRASAPKASGTSATQWEVEIENTGARRSRVTAWVLCSNGTAGA